MEVTLYSTGCPKCRVIESKLNKAGVPFTVVSDVDTMKDLGITLVPMMKVDDNELMDFKTANTWVNNYIAK